MNINAIVLIRCGPSVEAKPGELEKGIKAVWRESVRLKRFGFTATELDRAKNAYMSAVESEVKEKSRTNSGAYVKEYQENFLTGKAAPGIEKEYELIKADMPGITLADVNNLAATYIADNDRDVLILAPEKDKSGLPNEASVNSWLKAVDEKKLTAWKDEASTQPLLSKMPAPGKITSEELNKDLNITTITLSNGAKVLLKPTDFKNDQIVLVVLHRGGTSLSSDADFQSAANANAVVTAGGAGNYNSSLLSKFLQGKQLSIGPYIYERVSGISGSSTVKELETALQLLYARFTEPRKDTAIFKGIISRSKPGFANRANDPNSVFNDTVSAVWGNYNIRRTGPSLQKLEQINLDKAFRFYKERFADASNFTFTLLAV